MAVTARRFN